VPTDASLLVTPSGAFAQEAALDPTEQIARLQSEVTYLRDELARLSEPPPARSQRPPALAPDPWLPDNPAPFQWYGPGAYGAHAAAGLSPLQQQIVWVGVAVVSTPARDLNRRRVSSDVRRNLRNVTR
jgi:hypothetical protein